MVVTTFPLAPAGFDPLKADSASLCQYGYPPRPDETQNCWSTGDDCLVDPRCKSNPHLKGWNTSDINPH